MSDSKTSTHRRRSGRDQLDPSRALPGDLAPRDAQDLTAYPFFLLAKSKRIVPIDFQAGRVSIRVETVPQHGMATIWDADPLIRAASPFVEDRDFGPRLMAATPYEILTFVVRGTNMRDCDRLKAALDRLQSATVVMTSIRQPTVLSGTKILAPSGTGSSGYQGPKFWPTSCCARTSRSLNFPSLESFGFLLTDANALCVGPQGLANWCLALRNRSSTGELELLAWSRITCRSASRQCRLPRTVRRLAGEKTPGFPLAQRTLVRFTQESNGSAIGRPDRIPSRRYGAAT